jgi:phosphatidylserine decarboxylase
VQHLPIAKQGFPSIAVLVALFFASALAGWTAVAALSLLGALLVVNFFRDPERTVPLDPRAVVAPADGKIVFAGKVFEERLLRREALKVSIFMNVFNVHVNRIPFSGEITNVHYEKGKFLAANLDKASRDNEHNAVVLRLVDGEMLAFVQIAGLVARRIDCWVRAGDRVERGDRFGMIRFGSRVDLYAPTSCHLAVTNGQHVKGGESILCYYGSDNSDEKPPASAGS